MDKSLLVKLFGLPALLIHGDTLVIDRWNWIRKKLPITDKNLKVLDIGCGNGAFTIGLALSGYECLGWDVRNQGKAIKRAKILGTNRAKFDVQDVRVLDKKKELVNNFDIVICLETIEHIINDQKLMEDMSACLKPGGKLLLTTPNYDYIPMGIGDKKDRLFPQSEDGGHVRIGYRKEDLGRLCRNSNLKVEEISFCSGFLSQKITALMKLLGKINPLVGWTFILPLRIFPLLFDELIKKLFKWPGYLICLVAKKMTPQTTVAQTSESLR